MKLFRYVFVSIAALAIIITSQTTLLAQEKIGVLFIQHGGFEEYSEQNLWDASAHLFAVRPDHPVHKWVLFNSAGWSSVLQAGNAPKEIGKYSFEYERIGGVDPFPATIDTQVALLAQELQQRSCSGTEFVVDYSGWMNSENIDHFAYPRFLYNVPAYIAPFPFTGQTEETISGLTYCGEDEAGGPWADCDSERYNVDGPAERFIAEGVDRIIAIDLTTSGVRFFKTYDVLTMFKMALADNGGAGIPVHWINDPNGLMEGSLPTAPVGNWGKWTPDRGAPTADPSVPLADNPNPISSDIILAELLTEGAEASFNSAVPDASTGVLIMNHATGDYAQYFDPKIDDTLILNQNIKNMLLARHPEMDPDNIVGAYMGIQEDGTAEGFVGKERTRNMRGENLGHAWLYETSSIPGTYAAEGLLPGDEWGYKYWDALEYLKDRGVEHIVICFPQIVADSVLNMVEIPNQIAKEIGYKTWLKWGTWDYVSYPGIGHPFADYWGIWVNTECDDGAGGKEDCCFEMGGCADGRPYPPPRQTTDARDDLDPSLAYDVSEYGHLGYDPGVGAPDINSPVQNQYTGTWAMYQPPNDDIRLVEMLADHVLDAAGCEVIPDDAPAIGDGPFVAAGTWPLLPTGSPENPTYLNKNYYVLWTFSDDFGSCSGDCTHTAEYQVPGAETWTPLSVSSDAAQGFAYTELPITGLQNATTYAFRFAVTDCAGQSTQSGEYYFRVATSDAPPVIATGPFVAAGAWPLLPKSLSSAFVFDRNYFVLWTFSDDYASCGGDCTHRARYRKVDAVDWTWIQVGTDSSGKWYALTELPIESMEPGDYMFHFDVLDCAGQRTGAPNVYYFKVADPQ